MGTFLLRDPWFYLYLFYLVVLCIAFICASPRAPETGLRPNRRQDPDRSSRPLWLTATEKFPDTRYNLLSLTSVPRRSLATARASNR